MIIQENNEFLTAKDAYRMYKDYIGRLNENKTKEFIDLIEVIESSIRSAASKGLLELKLYQSVSFKENIDNIKNRLENSGFTIKNCAIGRYEDPSDFKTSFTIVINWDLK